MIEISSAAYQDKIIELLNNLNKDGIQFSYKEKRGLIYILRQTQVIWKKHRV